MIRRSLQLLTRHSLRPLVSRQLSLSVPCMVDKLPPLMEFPPIGMPKLSYTIRNWFMAKTLITPYFDNDFSMTDFADGAKHAALTVSNGLAEGDFDDMKNYLTTDCLETVEKSIGLFNKTERSALSMVPSDIYFSFVYQIGILMEDHPTEENKSIRHVEITWVGQQFPNYQEVIEQCGNNPMEVKKFMDLHGGPQILNYRFIREFTKEVEDSWTINALNHFMLLDPNIE
eukprot:TRINITY_DN12615_c0_g1_i1.p1 TRINITY_DN12615_c0_g1~~TRINITY_DN12615_c0_g1_i1.p1  ORF type:complete len:229 (+),score=49.40 TRINITY_DN12615_c0_g1_i1:35-721(+)